MSSRGKSTLATSGPLTALLQATKKPTLATYMAG